MSAPKRKKGGENGDSEKPTLTYLPGGPKIKRKRTYTKIARAQINRQFLKLARTNQLELPVRKTRQTIEETRKPISKLIRTRRNSKNKQQVTRATLTSEGKLMRVLFRGSSKRWEDMDAVRKERYRNMVVETLVKRTQAVSRRKGNEKKTIKQVRENILPELEKSLRRLEETIRINSGKVSAERIQELRNMRSVVEGIISEMKAQTIPRERALAVVETKNRERETIPFPGEVELRQRELRVTPELARTHPQPREEKRDENETARPRAKQEAGEEEQLFDKIRARAATARQLKAHPHSAKAIKDYAEGRITRSEAQQIIANEMRGHFRRSSSRNGERTIPLSAPKGKNSNAFQEMMEKISRTPKSARAPYVPLTRDQKMARVMNNLRGQVGRDDSRNSTLYEPRIQTVRMWRAAYRPTKKWALAIRNRLRRAKR